MPTFLSSVLRHEAGKAELGLNIVSPSGKSVPYKIDATAQGERVSYIPMEPGPYHIYITYGGLEVPGQSNIHAVTCTLSLVPLNISVLC